jgi:ribosomal protein L37AE/L43A
MKNHIVECPKCGEKALHKVNKEISECAVCGAKVLPKPPEKAPVIEEILPVEEVNSEIEPVEG